MLQTRLPTMQEQALIMRHWGRLLTINHATLIVSTTPHCLLRGRNYAYNLSRKFNDPSLIQKEGQRQPVVPPPLLVSTDTQVCCSLHISLGTMVNSQAMRSYVL